MPKRMRWFARSGLIEPDDVREMLAEENSGFSLDATVPLGAHGRAGLEWLLRYCARPPLALERVERLDDEHVIYRLTKPQRDGTTALMLTPLELLDHLAALIPPPRRHRHCHHGVLAPNAPLRGAATAYGHDAADDPGASDERSRHPRPLRPATSDRRRAIYGPCWWRGCSSRCRRPARTEVRTSASSPSLPRPLPSSGFSPKSVSRDARP
jgi:hypothetical protein